MTPRNSLASAITFATAKHLANKSPSVAIKIRTQENYIQPLFVHNSPTVTREAGE